MSGTALGYRPELAWFGAGVKGGGTLFVVGMEGFEGAIVNTETPSAINEFNITSVRLGLGLGGGVGLGVLLAYNIPSMWQVNGTEVTDWGVNVSLGTKWSAIVKSLRYSGLLKVAGAFAKAKKTFGFTPHDLELIRNFSHQAYSIADLGTPNNAGKPAFIGIDVPGASVGSELSAHYLIGTISIS